MKKSRLSLIAFRTLLNLCSLKICHTLGNNRRERYGDRKIIVKQEPALMAYFTSSCACHNTCTHLENLLVATSNAISVPDLKNVVIGLSRTLIQDRKHRRQGYVTKSTLTALYLKFKKNRVRAENISSVIKK